MLRKLRDLMLEGGGRDYIAAASGLVRHGDWLYVIADDEHFLGIFPASGDAPGKRLSLLDPRLPNDPAARKASKPDLEVITLLPEAVWPPHGALLALGSGSTPRRCGGIVMPFDAGGKPGAPRWFDLAPLYAGLSAILPELNMEGAVHAGDALLLFQRGNGPAGVNAIIEQKWNKLRARIAGQGPEAAAQMEWSARRIQQVDLGAVRGIPLGFTDASVLPDGRVVFSAVAEDSASTYADGLCAGAAVGLLDAAGKVLSLQEVDPPYKVEGVHAEQSGSRVELLLVADADDPSRPAPLLAGILKID